VTGNPHFETAATLGNWRAQARPGAFAASAHQIHQKRRDQGAPGRGNAVSRWITDDVVGATHHGEGTEARASESGRSSSEDPAFLVQRSL